MEVQRGGNSSVWLLDHRTHPASTVGEHLVDAGGKETIPPRFNTNTKLGHEVANVVTRTVPAIPINLDF